MKEKLRSRTKPLTVTSQHLKAASRHEKLLATPEGPMLKMRLAQLEIRPVSKYIQTSVAPQKRVYIDYRPFHGGYVVAFQVLEE